MLDRAPPENGDAALRLAAASADPVARLRAATAALRRGGDAARWYAAARILASLRGTREAVWAGLSAGDPAAHRARGGG